MELLAARIGWTLYRPIGMPWYDEGYWNHERKFHGDGVARQYLEPWGSDDLGIREDRSHPGYFYRLVTLAEARDLRPDLVLSSLAHNHEGFARFASEVGATFALQVGNVRFSEADMAEDRWDLAAFGLVSGFMPVTPPKPHVVYHQEFSLEDFRYEPPARDFELYDAQDFPDSQFRVSSFVQCYPQDGGAYPAFTAAALEAPELDWRVYGAYGEATSTAAPMWRQRCAGRTWRGTPSAGRTATATSSITGSRSGVRCSASGTTTATRWPGHCGKRASRRSTSGIARPMR